MPTVWLLRFSSDLEFLFQVVGGVFLDGGWFGIDVILDDVALVYLFDLLEESIGFETGAEVADLHLEVGFIEDDVGLHGGVVEHEAVAQAEGAVFRVGTRKGGNLHSETGDGLHAVVEFHMAFHHSIDGDVAGDGEAAALGGN